VSDDTTLDREEPLPDDPGQLLEEPLVEALSRRYLAYALSTITARALPDVRDGLKPVQRRILYAMRELKLDPSATLRKCAKIVGDVMGDYHPHGDGAIYDALARLAQSFTVRYPLVDGQGNFGNIDGDQPAAMRYTESRLSHAAGLLLDGLDEDAVDFKPSYDGQKTEPVVLPAAFPNLLANGTTGIAVGMATSIPPHNVGECIDAALMLIEHPNASLDAVLLKLRGPDFPTGGVIVEPAESIREAYATGRGGFRLRARWSVEQLPRGGWRIVVAEVPYHVQKAKLIEDLAELIETKKAPLLGDVRDESAEDVRLVLEPKSRTVEPEVLMESLFKLSNLEVRFPLNMNVLDRGQPRVMGLIEVLKAFLEHRRDVLGRRTRHRLAKIDHRLEVLDGYLIAYLNLDEVIRIIREEDEPKPALMARFSLTDVQAEAILNMRLRALRKLEEFEIRGEHAKLSAERAELLALLADEGSQWTRIGDELRAARDVLAKNGLGHRRSGLADAPQVNATAALEALTPREPVTVILSKLGWLRAMKGHGVDVTGLKFKDGDAPAFAVEAQTTDRLILLATDGRAFTLTADKLPSARGQGEPIRLLVDLGNDAEAFALFPFQDGRRRLVASSAGYGFIVPEVELLSQKRGGKVVMTVDSGARFALAQVLADAADHVAVVGENRRLLLFPRADLPEMARGKGVKLQAYKEGGLLDVGGFTAADGFGWTDSGGRTRALPEWREWLGKRASVGKSVPKGWPKSGRFSADA
jgi:topoisomerase-4 subunit A